MAIAPDIDVGKRLVLTPDESILRLRIVVRGQVQGVGFRPEVYRLATAFGLTGWVINSFQGAEIEAEGSSDQLNSFKEALRSQMTTPVFVASVAACRIKAIGAHHFEIRESDSHEVEGQRTVTAQPDMAVCEACLNELFDPYNRRYRYPFLNCTHCGPRYSILDSFPYDRANTSMRHFQMCAACLAEYTEPANRRFHAQPNACPDCGPQLALWNQQGEVPARQDGALQLAEDAIRNGQIVALKGVGGFQLLVDARNETAVRRLRDRKQRPDKPFAIMVGSAEHAVALCHLSAREALLLQSIPAPIVLLNRRKNIGPAIAASVAPGLSQLGLMFPSSPLHHLLMRDLGFPIVATSGNRSDEPICIDEKDAFERLSDIADLFLVHNRPILRPIDDSVTRILLDQESMVRRARGYAPLPVAAPQNGATILAVGAQQKCAMGLTTGAGIIMSQHLGDLNTVESNALLKRTVEELTELYGSDPEMVVADLHPDYESTLFAERYASKLGIPCLRVQHHHAHVLACMADNALHGSVLGVAWDGTGYGDDGTIWGGEFLVADETGYRRVASLRPFRLPGGERASREPRRSAMGILHAAHTASLPEIFSNACTFQEFEALNRMLISGVNSPETSSIGRLFDAVASLIGVRQIVSFEGQAAMELQALARGCNEASTYAIPITRCESGFLVLDWEPMVQSILNELERGEAPNRIAARFHHGLANAIVEVAAQLGEPRVVLTGGCFQNSLLTELAVVALHNAGIQPYWHHNIPAGDGGIAVGQLVAGRSVGRIGTPIRRALCVSPSPA